MNINEILLTNTKTQESSELDIIRQLNNIILEYRNPNFNQKNNIRVGINKSVYYTYMFLNSIDKKYADYFEKRLNDNDVIFEYDKKEEQISESYFIESTKRKIIHVAYNETMKDTYTITHEILHDMNLDVNKRTKTRKLFTEYISMMGELLQEKYQQNITGKVSNKNMRDTFNYCYQTAVKIDLEIELIEAYKKYKNINYKVLINILKRKNPNNMMLYIDSYEQIRDTGKLSIDFHKRYIIRILLAAYTNQNIEKETRKIDIFKTINENMNDLSSKTILSILDLKLESEINPSLTTRSENELKDSYIKELKRR